MRRLLIILLIALSPACTSNKVIRAPVTDVSIIEPIPSSGVYFMRRGETLYSAAWRYGLDYRYLARRNHLKYPYHVHVGQKIYLKDFSPKIKQADISHPAKHIKPMIARKASVTRSASMSSRLHGFTTKKASLSSSIIWRWPVKGPVLAGFSHLNKGVNIGGRFGDPVYSTAPGRVVYCGDGLRGYGNLIIIKHDNRYLSAYAFNSQMSVKEGQTIKSGQKIAEIGYNANRKPMLHFEIRKEGNPVNPLMYLRG